MARVLRLNVAALPPDPRFARLKRDGWHLRQQLPASMSGPHFRHGRFTRLAHRLAHESPGTEETRCLSGFPRYRYGDSNPGFRTENCWCGGPSEALSWFEFI